MSVSKRVLSITVASAAVPAVAAADNYTIDLRIQVEALKDG